MFDISTLPNVDSATANLIYGVLKDDIVPGDGLGTPVRKDWISDLVYPFYAILNDAGITADGSPEGATGSQVLTALKKIIKDSQYPVGSFYVQYPNAASNDDATAFPVAGRPATMFGGTWVEQFNTDATFFRTGGTDYQTRTAGLSEDEMQGWQAGGTADDSGARNLYGLFNLRNYRASTVSGATNFSENVYTTTGQGSASMIKAMNDGTNGDPRTGAVTEPRNRLIKLWKRTVL